MEILIYLSIKPKYSILWIVRQIYIDDKLILHNWTNQIFCYEIQSYLMQTRQTELVITNSTNNLLSYCGSIDARMSDSDKEQPVNMFCWFVTEEVL